MGEGAAAADGAACRWLCRGGDSVGLLLEVGHKGAVGGDGEGEAGIGGNLRSSFGPVDESITWVGRGGQIAGGTVVVSAATADVATCCRVGCGSDGVGLQLEVCNVSGRFGYVESISGVGGDLCAILGPVDEGVARVGRGSYRAALVVVESSTSADTDVAACSRFGTDGDCIYRRSTNGDIYRVGMIRFATIIVRGDVIVIGTVGEARVGVGGATHIGGDCSAIAVHAVSIGTVGHEGLHEPRAGIVILCPRSAVV